MIKVKITPLHVTGTDRWDRIMAVLTLNFGSRWDG